MANEKDIAGIVALIGAAYPNFNPTEHTVEVYFETLRDIPADLLKTAALKSIAEPGRKFAPSVGELRGAVGEIQRAVSGVPSSYQAWQEVMQAMLEVGSYRTPEFSHPLIAETVRVMGWKNLCLSENAVADRARFIQAYEQLAERADNDAMMLPQVRGYIEENSGRLLPSTSIKMLVDKWSVK